MGSRGRNVSGVSPVRGGGGATVKNKPPRETDSGSLTRSDAVAASALRVEDVPDRMCGGRFGREVFDEIVEGGREALLSEVAGIVRPRHAAPVPRWTPRADRHSLAR